MRLKSFYAKTMTEAMQMIRDTLGEDAIIVATREEKGKNSVCVTAALEQHDGAPAFELGQNGSAAGAKTWLQYDDEDEVAAVAEDLTDAMIRHGVPEEITDQILSYTSVIGFDDVQTALHGALESLFSFRPLQETTLKNKFLFVGPPGAGKTLSVAKFAAQAVMNNEEVVAITTDIQRAGAVEQLEAFTKILGIDLHQVKTPTALAEILNSINSNVNVFIDAPGLNPFDPESIKALARLCGAGDIEPVLVLPAATDVHESEDLARIYAAIGTRVIVPTRLDMARRYGGLLAAAHKGNLTFAEAGVSQNVADGLKSLTPKGFARYLVPSVSNMNRNKKRN